MKLFLCFLFFSLEVFAFENYTDIISQLDYYNKEYTHLELFNLGLNNKGEMIKGILYKGEGVGDKKINHLVVGAHHGNEVLSTKLTMEFIQLLAKKGSSFLKDYNLYLVPVLNINGFNSKSRREEDEKGVLHDPNRDYPDPCVIKKNFKLKSTAALASLVRSEEIVGAITIHGYYGSLTYPWGIFTDNYESLDHKLFEEKAHQATRFNSYTIGTHADILYSADGAFEDWAYYELGVWSYLVELESSPNLNNDMAMLVESLRNMPRKKSQDHRHLGNCTYRRGLGISRP